MVRVLLVVITYVKKGSSSPSSQEARHSRKPSPQDRQRRNTDAQYLHTNTSQSPTPQTDRPLSASAGARLQGSKSEPPKRPARATATPSASEPISAELLRQPVSGSRSVPQQGSITSSESTRTVSEVTYPTSFYTSGSEPDLSMGTDTESPRAPYLYPSSSEDVVNPPPSLQSTLHYSSSEDSNRAPSFEHMPVRENAADSRKPPPSPAHTSRPTTPLMVDNNDSYLIQDEADDVLSEASSSLSESPQRSSKAFKKSHRRAYSDNLHAKVEPAIPLQAPPPDKKSKRRSMMGSFLSFLKNVFSSFFLLLLLYKS